MAHHLKLYTPNEISEDFFIQEVIEEYKHHPPQVREQARKLFEHNYLQTLSEYTALMKKIMDPDYGK